MLQTPNSIWFVFLWHGFFLSGRQIYIKEYDWSVINIYCCKGFDGRCSHTNSLGKASLYLSYKTKFCAYLSPPHSNNGTKHNCSPRKKSLVEYIEYLTKSWLFWWRQRRAPLLSNNSDSCNMYYRTPPYPHTQTPPCLNTLEKNNVLPLVKEPLPCKHVEVAITNLK